jgi:hypothetical protein
MPLLLAKVLASPFGLLCRKNWNAANGLPASARQVEEGLPKRPAESADVIGSLAGSPALSS